MKHEGENPLQYQLVDPLRDATAAIGRDAVLKGMLSGLMTGVSYFLGNHYIGVATLVALIVIDQIFGTMVAFRQEKFQSAKFRAGLIKVLVYTLLVVAFHLLEQLHPLIASINVDRYALIYLAMTEAISIVENARELTGISLPKWIVELIRSLGKKK